MPSRPSANTAKTVSISYCGGCNAGYDRVAFVRELLAAAQEAGAQIELVASDARADMAIVMAGCQALCVADRFDLGGLALSRHVVGPQTLDAVKMSHEKAAQLLVAELLA